MGLLPMVVGFGGTFLGGVVSLIIAVVLGALGQPVNWLFNLSMVATLVSLTIAILCIWDMMAEQGSAGPLEKLVLCMC